MSSLLTARAKTFPTLATAAICNTSVVANALCPAAQELSDQFALVALSRTDLRPAHTCHLPTHQADTQHCATDHVIDNKRCDGCEDCCEDVAQDFDHLVLQCVSVCMYYNTVWITRQPVGLSQ